MKKLSALFLIISFLFIFTGPLPAQSGKDIIAELETLLPNGAAIFMAVDEGRFAAIHGEDILNQTASPGSILKIFTTYAILASGQQGDEIYYCPPSSVDEKSTESCWFKPGHGNMNLKQALANSCNSYFRQWLSEKDLEPAFSFFDSLGFDVKKGRNQQESLKILTGMSTQMQVKPVNLVLATAALFNGGRIYAASRGEGQAELLPLKSIDLNGKVINFIKSAMLEAYHLGNAQGIFPASRLEKIYVKTGTSQAKAKGTGGQMKYNPLQVDGWCILVFKCNKKNYLLLVYRPEGTGVEAARVAGKLVQIFQETKCIE
jgi:cell division protein FtsI/penicillin-binding protein 2